MLKVKINLMSLNRRGVFNTPPIFQLDISIIYYIKSGYYFFLIIFFLSSCTGESKSCCKELSQSSPINKIPDSLKIDSNSVTTIHIDSIYNRTGQYANFGFQFFTTEGMHYLVYLNSSKDSLIFINLFDDKDYKMANMKGLIKSQGKYTIKFISDTLHIMDIEGYHYMQLKLMSDFRFEKIYESSLSKAIEPKHLFLNSNLVVDKKLAFFNPYLISFYGNYKTKNNMDSKAWIKINIQTGEKENFFDFPDEYRRCYQRDFYSLIEKISDSSVLAIFRKHNKIYQVNIFSGVTTYSSTGFSFYSNYMCYDKTQEKNLAYTSKYDLLDEENSNLIWANDKIFLIKRLKRENKKDPVKCAILVFNKTLEHVATYFPDKSVWPRLSFAYKEGVLILSDSLTKAYYYGFKNN